MGEYDRACADYHSTEVERTNNLNNLQKIVNRLLKKGNVSTGTQTDPIVRLENLDALTPLGNQDHIREVDNERKGSEEGARGQLLDPKKGTLLKTHGQISSAGDSKV